MKNYINHLNALYNNGEISRTQKQKVYDLFEKNLFDEALAELSSLIGEEKLSQLTEKTPKAKKSSRPEPTNQQIMTLLNEIAPKISFMYGWTIFTIIISVISIFISLVVVLTNT